MTAPTDVLPSSLEHYLATHLAGAAGAIPMAEGLADRLDDVEMSRIVAEIKEEKALLESAMRECGLQPSLALKAVTRVTEGLSNPARQLLHAHGRAMRDLAELESLLLGVTGRRALWGLVAELDHPLRDILPLDDLRAQAERHIDEVDRMRRRAGRDALDADR